MVLLCMRPIAIMNFLIWRNVTNSCYKAVPYDPATRTIFVFTYANFCTLYPYDPATYKSGREKICLLYAERFVCMKRTNQTPWFVRFIHTNLSRTKDIAAQFPQKNRRQPTAVRELHASTQQCLRRRKYDMCLSAMVGIFSRSPLGYIDRQAVPQRCAKSNGRRYTLRLKSCEAPACDDKIITIRSEQVEYTTFYM